MEMGYLSALWQQNMILYNILHFFFCQRFGEGQGDTTDINIS